MAFPDDLTQQQLVEFFPTTTPAVAKGVFELGLVLGGTVSAGAYTAGVLDCLVQALDAWQRAKEQHDPEAPPHQVVITTVGGTSGGAINGALLLRAVGREFDHGESLDNPFFAAWTRGIDLMALLSPSDDGPGLASILNTAVIDKHVATSVNWNGGRALGAGTSPARRGYLGDPLRLIMMVANLTGIPYRIAMMGDSGLAHELVGHADYMRFALAVPGGAPQRPEARPDELPLSSGLPINWDVVGKTSLATSAFPVAFRARDLERSLEAVGYRAIAIPDDKGSATVQQLIPKWGSLPLKTGNPSVAPFANVDGGTFNNQPLDVVRVAMAGMAGCNPRNAKDATRAVILIDPFSDPATLNTPDTGKLTSVIGPLLASMIQQPRFKPTDLALAYNEEVYSRFLVAPTRIDANGGKIIGKRAIASGGLGGFLGFVDFGLLVHDYALGRANAHAFLSRHLMLPEDGGNVLFDDWTERHKQKYRYVDPKTNKGYLPIIPLMDGLRDRPPPTQPWPAPVSLPQGFSAAVEARLDVVYDRLKAQFAPDSGWQRALANTYLWLGWRLYGRAALRDAAIKAIEDGLRDQGLSS